MPKCNTGILVRLPLTLLVYFLLWNRITSAIGFGWLGLGIPFAMPLRRHAPDAPPFSHPAPAEGEPSYLLVSGPDPVRGRRAGRTPERRRASRSDFRGVRGAYLPYLSPARRTCPPKREARPRTCPPKPWRRRKLWRSRSGDLHFNSDRMRFEPHVSLKNRKIRGRGDAAMVFDIVEQEKGRRRRSGAAIAVSVAVDSTARRGRPAVNFPYLTLVAAIRAPEEAPRRTSG